jgi:hypothetical protein
MVLEHSWMQLIVKENLLKTIVTSQRLSQRGSKRCWRRRLCQLQEQDGGSTVQEGERHY